MISSAIDGSGLLHMTSYQRCAICSLGIISTLLNEIYYNLIMTDFERSLYEMLGGETGLRSLVNRFYDLMDSSPEAEKIRAFHAKSLNQSREKLFMFLSGWSGGPQLYIERFGHPRLRMRHMPFAIGTV